MTPGIDAGAAGTVAAVEAVSEAAAVEATMGVEVEVTEADAAHGVTHPAPGLTTVW